jgi:hypothetical protein
MTCLATLAFAAGSASAEAESLVPSGAPDDSEVAVRLAWIEGVLDREGAATRAWQWSWVGAYGAATIVEGALLATAKTPTDRVNDGVYLGKAALAFGFVLVSPASAATGARVVRVLPAGTPAERLAKLRLAESTLRALAVEERERRGWFPLIGAALVNAAGGFVTWAAYRGSGASGWFDVASGMAVAQIQFHTEPTGAIRAWDAYRRAGDGGTLGEPPAVLRWSIRPTAGGVAVTGAF